MFLGGSSGIPSEVFSVIKTGVPLGDPSDILSQGLSPGDQSRIPSEVSSGIPTGEP